MLPVAALGLTLFGFLKRNETGAEAAGFQLMVVGWWLMRIYGGPDDAALP